MVVQWLKLQIPNAGDLGSIPGLGTRSHVLQLKKKKILHAAMKIENPTCHNYDPVQINFLKYFLSGPTETLPESGICKTPWELYEEREDSFC